MRARLLTAVSIAAIAWPNVSPLAQVASTQPAVERVPRQPTTQAEGASDYQRFVHEHLLPRGYPGIKPNQKARLEAWKAVQRMPAYKGGAAAPTDATFAPPRNRNQTSYPPGSPNGPNGGSGGPGGGKPGTTDMQGCAWVSRGPTNINGRITSVAVDPNNNKHVFVVGVGGIWRSLDGARTWERVSDDFLASVFASVAVNPANGAEVIAGGGDPDYQSSGAATGLGIWVSTSTGATTSWSKVSPAELDDQIIYRLRYDSSGDVYAATSVGLYLGTHSGGTITFTKLGGMDASVQDFAVDFSTTPPKVYAGLNGSSTTYSPGVWKYDGTTWTKKTTGMPTTDLGTIAIAIAKSSPSTLYAKIAKASNGDLLDVYKTTTGAEPPGGGGNAWTALGATALDDSHFNSKSGYSWYNSMIEVDPNDPNTVWSAGTHLYRSTSGGSSGSWVNVSSGADSTYAQYAHDDHHSVAFDPTNSKIVYDGDDGGLVRSTDTSSSTWSWRLVSHNMTSTQAYKSTTQWAPVSFIATGNQDNGTEQSFGNRAWLEPGGCDGNDVGIDAKDASTLYANCDGGLSEFVNPVPGTPGGLTTATWSPPSGIDIVSPIITDYKTAGAALAAGQRQIAQPAPPAPGIWEPIRVLKTTDGLTWKSASSELETDGGITRIATAPSSNFKTWYVGIADTGGTSSVSPTIWRTDTAGSTWVTTATGIPNLYPSGIAVDYSTPLRAIATFSGGGGGQVLITTDGQDWTPIMGSGVNALPATASYNSVAIDPTNANVVYVASNVGMFRGELTTSGGTTTASWTTFNEGLPDGLDVNSVMAEPSNGFLEIGTWGWATWERDINPGDLCPAHFAYVRDNTEDRGYLPSPSAVPDPEWPIPDPSRPGFYKPDDTSDGELYWWTSADVKIDVPSQDPPANKLSAVDSVEFDSCPTRLSSCPAGTLLDNNPIRGQAAKVYVQVENRGTQDAHNVRVIALYADATTGLPLLPNDFWSTTFPAGAGACGALSSGSDWHAPDPSTICKTISDIRPDRPEVVSFDWNVSSTQAAHSCMLVIIESTEQPLDSTIRSTNQRQLWVLVPGYDQIANRNLHIVDSDGPGGTAGGAEGMGVPNPRDSDQVVNLSIDKGELFSDGKLIIVLPPEAKGTVPELSRQFRQVTLPRTAEIDAMVHDNKLDASLAFELTTTDGTIPLRVPAMKSWKIGLVYDSGHGKPNTAARFSVISRQGSDVLGGSTFLLRIDPTAHH